jgi:hypothetical protein
LRDAYVLSAASAARTAKPAATQVAAARPAVAWHDTLLDRTVPKAGATYNDRDHSLARRVLHEVGGHGVAATILGCAVVVERYRAVGERYRVEPPSIFLTGPPSTFLSALTAEEALRPEEVQADLGRRVGYAARRVSPAP